MVFLLISVIVIVISFICISRYRCLGFDMEFPLTSKPRVCTSREILVDLQVTTSSARRDSEYHWIGTYKTV
jgi:hypothetical protein